MAEDEGTALAAVLDVTAPSAPTACAGWTAHDVVAHLAAGAKEHADLIEHKLSGRPERATRGFEEREAPFRALEHGRLMGRLAEERRRKQQAFEALDASGDPSIAFTGTRITKGKSEIHSRSEAALHRWDIAGDDGISAALLSQPELASHAVWVLNNMPVLSESAHALGIRAATVSRMPAVIVFRAAGQPDIVLTLDTAASRFRVVPETAAGDLILTMRADHRLLALWGRRPAAHTPEVDGDRSLLAMLERVLWPDATPWA